MKFYLLRDRVTKLFITNTDVFGKSQKSPPRVYATEAHAHSARMFLVQRPLRVYRDIAWYDLSKEELEKACEQLIEIVEFDAVEVTHDKE